MSLLIFSRLIELLYRKWQYHKVGIQALQGVYTTRIVEGEKPKQKRTRG